MVATLRVTQLSGTQAQQNGEGLSTTVIMIEVGMTFGGKMRHGSTACELSYLNNPDRLGLQP